MERTEPNQLIPVDMCAWGSDSGVAGMGTRLLYLIGFISYLMFTVYHDDDNGRIVLNERRA